MIVVSTTLNKNKPVKKQKLADWINKQDPTISYLQETHFRDKDTS